MTAPPRVSVIVPVYRDVEGLGSCLRRLEEQDYPAESREVLVVDNGDTDRIRDLVEGRPGCRYLAETRPGSYAARNRGLAEASGEIIAFTDADCLPRRDWLSRGVAALSGSPVPAMVVGRIRILFADPDRPTSVELFESVASFRQEEYVRRWRFGATANVLVHRAVIDAVGPFDAGYRSLGDVEWGRRVHAAGVPQVYSAETEVEHPARRTVGEFRRRAARMTGGFRRLSTTSGLSRRDLLAYAFCGLVPVGRLLETGPGAPLRGPGQRLRVLGVAMLVVSVRVWEMVRLRLGGEPGR